MFAKRFGMIRSDTRHQRGPETVPLWVNDLTVAYHRKPVLWDVDLSLPEGRLIAVVGPNGAGKSTFIKAVLNLVPRASGAISIYGKPYEVQRHLVGYVPQRLAIDPTLPLTVGRFLDLPTRADRVRKHAALARVGIEGLERRAMTELSGGQFQRVLLARALLAEPQLLMLDEPTQGLDQIGEAAFYRLIEAVRRDTGCGVLMVSHDLHVVMSASDRVICLNKHICCEGAPSHVASAPAYRALFGQGTEGALALYPHDHGPRDDGSLREGSG